MSQIAEELKVTYTDILVFGESNQRMELFDGEFIMTAMPNITHQRIAMKLGLLLYNYVSQRKLGVVLSNPVDVYLSGTTVLQPDVTFLSNERHHINDGKKYTASPDLVIEILSESTEERDRNFKFREYARYGAKEYWLVSPEKREIEVYQNSPRGFQLVNKFSQNYTLNSPLFADIALKVEQVFE